MRLALVPTRRTAAPVLEPRAKVTSRMNAILAELDAAVSGSLSLMQDADGFLTENSVANVFLVIGGQIHTAPAHKVLEGVTRATVLELAAELGIWTSERDVSAYDLAQCEEVFLSSSAFGVMPVRAVDRFRPKASSPGPVTTRLMEGFSAAIGLDVGARALADDDRAREAPAPDDRR